MNMEQEFRLNREVKKMMMMIPLFYRRDCVTVFQTARLIDPLTPDFLNGISKKSTYYDILVKYWIKCFEIIDRERKFAYKINGH